MRTNYVTDNWSRVAVCEDGGEQDRQAFWQKQSKKEVSNLADSQTGSYLNVSSVRIVEINQSLVRSVHCAQGKLGDPLDMVLRLVLDAVGDTHPGVSNCFLFKRKN